MEEWHVYMITKYFYIIYQHMIADMCF